MCGTPPTWRASDPNERGLGESPQVHENLYLDCQFIIPPETINKPYFLRRPFIQISIHQCPNFQLPLQFLRESILQHATSTLHLWLLPVCLSSSIRSAILCLLSPVAHHLICFHPLAHTTPTLLPTRSWSLQTPSFVPWLAWEQVASTSIASLAVRIASFHNTSMVPYTGPNESILRFWVKIMFCSEFKCTGSP